MADSEGIDRLFDDAAEVLAAVREIGRGALHDLASVAEGLSHGDDLDEWDPEYIRRTLPLWRRVFGAYFRPEVRGMGHIPQNGPALLVGNHSGGISIVDTFILAVEFYSRFGPRRRFHQLAHDLAVRLPITGSLRRYGTLAASHENARAALRLGAPLLVYPGGDYETFRPSWESDEVQFAGRQGFVRLALSESVPIVPVVALGGQETALFVTRGEQLARLLRLDRLLRLKVLPVSFGPPLGPNILDLPGRVPLPAKIAIEVRPPINLLDRYGPDPDRDIVYEEVTGEMQGVLDRLSEERSAPLLG